MAGRLIDGHWFAQDGRDPVWQPPDWIRLLEADGYDSELEGEPFYVVTDMHLGELARFGNLRAAFTYALDALRRDRHPESLAIDCRTSSGRSAPVVWGRPVRGMARGALEAEPVRVIEAPAD
ncbi:MAG: hypothetical protein ACRDF7_09025 [Candidatus Limnocylindrales bacterium]